MDEHQEKWKEMTNIMMKINKESDEIFNTIHVIDQVINYFKTILQ